MYTIAVGKFFGPLGRASTILGTKRFTSIQFSTVGGSKPAVKALEEGKSVVIAPEGTRSKDGRLGEFKRGAFHLAMQAGVPIVPIVIHNATDALPNKSLVVRPAEVKVTVLKPVDTSDWTLRSVAPATRRIHKAYLDILGK